MLIVEQDERRVIELTHFPRDGLSRFSRRPASLTDDDD
jgi:hypothetical protein